jgi:hypothetical protein
MRTCSVAALSIVAALASPVLAETTEHFLIPLEDDMPGDGEAVVVEQPRPVSFETGDCGTSFTVLGDGGDSTNSPAEHYGGTAYSGELEVSGSGRVSAFVMAHKVEVGTHLSNIQLIDSGQRCSERINGKNFVFRKYSAVWH